LSLIFIGLNEKPITGPARMVSSGRFALKSTWSDLSTNYRKYLLIILIFTLGNSSDAFLLLRAQQLGVPVALLPTIWVALHIVKMVFSVPGGIVSDRIGRKRVIIAGWIVYATVYAGFAFAVSQWHAWVLFTVYGIYFGLTEGVEKALVADFAPENLRGSAFGLYNLVVGAGALPASLIFGFVWQKFGAAAAFCMGAGFAVLASVMIALLTVKKTLQDVR